MDEKLFYGLRAALTEECMRVEKDVALGRERRLFPKIPAKNSLESRALMLRGTRHDEGRRFGAKAASFVELEKYEVSLSPD
jgi:hypothetical protein